MKKRVNLYADIKFYTRDGIIQIDKAKCKVAENMQDVLVLNVPKREYSPHLYPKGGNITDENKTDKKDKHSAITKKDLMNYFIHKA